MLNLLSHTVISTVGSQQVSCSKYYLPRRELPGPTVGSRPGGGARWQAPGSRTFACGFQSRKQHGTPFSWAHHLQEEPKRLGAFSVGWQPKAKDNIKRQSAGCHFLADVMQTKTVWMAPSPTGDARSAFAFTISPTWHWCHELKASSQRTLRTLFHHIQQHQVMQSAINFHLPQRFCVVYRAPALLLRKHCQPRVVPGSLFWPGLW